jgi:hypothetical protein
MNCSVTGRSRLTLQSNVTGPRSSAIEETIALANTSTSRRFSAPSAQFASTVEDEVDDHLFLGRPFAAAVAMQTGTELPKLLPRSRVV